MKRKILAVVLGVVFSLNTVNLVGCNEPGHTHSYVKNKVAPTCTRQGYTTYTCECGNSYIDNYVDELGHKFTNYVSNNNATCEQDGTKTAICDYGCGETDTIADLGSKLEHKFTNYVSDNNATYEQDGTKTASCDHGCGETDTKIDLGTQLVRNEIKFKTLTKNGTQVSGKLPNGTTEFSFAEEIETSGTATYGVYLDKYCSQLVKTGIVPLSEGDNTFYIYAENTDSGDIIYTVTINIKVTILYSVSFNTNGGTYVPTQTVEENLYAQEPTATITKTGYIFEGWDFDFENTKIT